MKVVKKGDRGEDVKILQSKLGLKDDGIFGQNTEKTVKEFQKKNGLVADGIVGNKTWEVLLKSTNNSKYESTSGLKKCTKRTIKGIVLHCSATAEGQDYTVDDIRKWHKQRGFDDIGYHYIIYRDGSVHIGRDVDIAGAHTTGHNAKTIGICYIGGVDSKNNPKDTRTEAQKRSLIALVKELIKMYGLSPMSVHAHYEYANKACPSFKIVPFRKELA